MAYVTSRSLIRAGRPSDRHSRYLSNRGGEQRIGRLGQVQLAAIPLGMGAVSKHAHARGLVRLWNTGLDRRILYLPLPSGIPETDMSDQAGTVISCRPGRPAIEGCQ